MGKAGGRIETKRKTANWGVGKSHNSIVLVISDYNDIFSNFDPRSYSVRSLSVDFIDETKRASIDKAIGGLKLQLIVPGRLRDQDLEIVIKRRLKAHFKKHLKKIHIQNRRMIHKGIAFIIAGAATMFLATLFLFRYAEQDMFKHFMLILLEPAGWFFFWEGLNLIIFETEHKKPEEEFYKKMAACAIKFASR